MARRNEARRAEMRRLIEEQETSGTSLARFARERGISPWTLYNWRRQLRVEDAEKPSRFVEVKLTAKSRAAPPIAVELAGGLRVQVPRGFEEDHLRRLLAVLSSC